MKILLTNHQMARRGGTELYVLEMSAALRHRGHEVCVFSTLAGEIAQGLEASGVSLVTHPAECPFSPDILHCQHHLEAMAALAAWPGTPALYCLHGAEPWEEQPPKHPRIFRYLAHGSKFGRWLEKLHGIHPDNFAVVRNFFDPARFDRRRPADRPFRRALVFHNTMHPDGPAFAALQRACADCGIALDAAGAAFGKMLPHPEQSLPEYDLVFAAGRSAIEAMACGCAVIPITREQSAPRVTPENFAVMADRNFAAESDAPPLDAGEVSAEIRGLDAAQTAECSQRIRDAFTLDAAVAHLEEQYRLTLTTAASAPARETGAESAALADYLVGLARKVKAVDENRSALVDQKYSAQSRAEKWKRRAGKLENRLAHIRQEMEQAGGFLRRRLWRRLRRHWDEGGGQPPPDSSDSPLPGAGPTSGA